MNPARQWDFLFRAAADPEYTTAKNFWEKEVKDNVLAYSSYRKTFTQITADGSVLDNLPRKVNITYNSSTPYRQQSSHPGVPAKGYGKRQSPDPDPNPHPCFRQPQNAGTSTREKRDTETGSVARTVAYTFAIFAARHILNTCATGLKVRTKVVTKARARTKAETNSTKARRSKSEAPLSTLRHPPAGLSEPLSCNATQPLTRANDRKVSRTSIVSQTTIKSTTKRKKVPSQPRKMLFGCFFYFPARQTGRTSGSPHSIKMGM
jgi:hypothetical protein